MNRARWKAARGDAEIGFVHPKGVWVGNEEVNETTVFAGKSDMAITLLLYPNDGATYLRAVNTLTREDRARILRLFCEGSSIRAITRVTGASKKKTVVKLLIPPAMRARPTMTCTQPPRPRKRAAGECKIKSVTAPFRERLPVTRASAFCATRIAAERALRLER